MSKHGAMCLALAMLASCATRIDPPRDVQSQLAPTGTLRAGVNFGNSLLIAKGEAGGDPRGVVVDVARELGARLGVPVKFVAYDRPALLADAAQSGDWDIAFLAVEPAGAATIHFSPPYATIEASYLVRQSLPWSKVDEFDRADMRIAVASGSAYDLFLTRSLKAARLIRVQSSDVAVKELVAGNADAVPGIKQVLSRYTNSASELRVVDGSFMTIQQAIGVPNGRDAAAA